MIDVYYVVVPVAEVTQDMFAHCATSNIDVARKSSDGTKCLLELEGQIPPLFYPYQAIPYSRIHEYLLHNEETWGDYNGDGQIGFLGNVLNFFGL